MYSILVLSCLLYLFLFILVYSCLFLYPYNPVGGIHTVIRSKAGVTTGELGDLYCMIGPYHEPTVRLEVEVMEPELSVTKEVIESMKKEGVNVSNSNI